MNIGSVKCRRIYFALVGVQSIAISVCLTNHLHISKTTHAKFTKFSVCHLWPWLGLPPTAMQYNTSCTSGFVDDVMFSHNGPNKPEWKTTHRFRASISPGAKSTVSDGKCRRTKGNWLTRIHLKSCFLNGGYVRTFIRDSRTIVATDVSSASRSNNTSQAVSLNITQHLLETETPAH